ncbi:MAG TPA: hypothetical protein VMM78_10030 [Thermomicrobiales bacterium]|nr:hypothetical protein [Thermomicrobiales bacterium]
MAIQPQEIEYTRGRIKEAILKDRGHLSPADLIDNLRAAGVDEDHVRLVMWFLLDQQEIELDRDWKLVTPNGANGTS